MKEKNMKQEKKIKQEKNTKNIEKRERFILTTHTHVDNIKLTIYYNLINCTNGNYICIIFLSIFRLRSYLQITHDIITIVISFFSHWIEIGLSIRSVHETNRTVDNTSIHANA